MFWQCTPESANASPWDLAVMCRSFGGPRSREGIPAARSYVEMKGVVFTELLDMVDDRFGPEVTERVLEACNLDSGGAYTAVGTYDHAEILQLVGALAHETGIEGRALVRAFGKHLFHRLVEFYPAAVTGQTDPLAFAKTIQSHIHVEVRKLYPDAELPEIGWLEISETEVEVTYRSTRPFADLCLGLLEGSIEFFGLPTDIIADQSDDSRSATFRLSRAV